ncbi:MAG: N-acetyltransferase [Azospirillaceae bacterium]|nr:N-acetyltransferase [Azospirillaceae bacterium]
MTIFVERPHHAAAIEALLDSAFGPNRFAKTAYRFRDGVGPVGDLCLVAENDRGEIEGTIRYWPVMIAGRCPSLLLGPIAVVPDCQGNGLGAALIRASLMRAAAAGHRSVILVGDEPYYRRFGFVRALTRSLTLPGPVDLDRFLGLELVPGALRGLAGAVTPWVAPVPAAARSRSRFSVLARQALA